MPHSSLHIIWTNVANHSDYVEFNNNSLLFGRGSHSGNIKVVRYLQQKGVESIDYLFYDDV
jgi:beta-lactamase superfamily II metal-dependent hydrolase